MRALTNLRVLFSIVAIVECAYALLGTLTPPSIVPAVTGWVLTADGQWLTKLMGLSLATQAWIAWTLRTAPHVGVAKALAFYQIGSAAVDGAMWIVLADQGIFSTGLGKFWAAASIPTHFTLGVLLLVGIRQAPNLARATARHPSTQCVPESSLKRREEQGP